MSKLKDRLIEARAEKLLSQGALAKLAKCGQTTIASIENGRNQGSKILPKLAEILDVNVFWLTEGRGNKRGYSSAPVAKTADASSDISVPLLSNIGSMGGGAELLDGDLVIGALTVQRSWVSKNLQNLTSPENLRFIHGYGDSMKPTFSDGDVLLIDSGVRTPTIDGVYVLEVNKQLYIKRVSRRFDGHHEISSDNPLVKTVEVLNGDHLVEIKGRVVWAWRGERL